MSDILKLREALNSPNPREAIDLYAVEILKDRPVTSFDILHEYIAILRNTESNGASLEPQYLGLLADRLEDVLQSLAAVKRDHKYYMEEWSKVCNENQGLINALEWYADEARACSKYIELKTNTSENALMACVTVLALDGGRRADRALASGVRT